MEAAFPRGAVTSYRVADGNYTIRVEEPTNLKNNQEDAEEALVYGRDKSSKNKFLQRLLTDKITSWKNSKGEPIHMIMIPESSSKTERELYEDAVSTLNSAISNLGGNPYDFHLSDRLVPKYNNGRIVGYGFTVIPKETKGPSKLESSITRQAEQKANEMQRWKFDAAQHERQLVDPQLA